MKNYRAIVFILSIFGTNFFCLAASTLRDKSVAFIDNKEVISGKLRNGLQYHLIPNAKPEKRISLRLCVKAGSYFENDAEDGIAHFIEHMTFNGTKHFAPGTLIQYFQRIGMGFGSDTNACTRGTSTIYQIDLPDNTQDVLLKGLEVLYDQAFECLFLPQEIERERGVILSELRNGDSAEYRAMKAELQFLFPQHIVSQHFTIGTEASIKSFQSKDFFNFYKRWYIPQRMHLTIVGDFEKREKVVKDCVRKVFSKAAKVKKAAQPNSLQFSPKPQKDLSIKVFHDEKLSNVAFSLSALQPAIPDDKLLTYGDLKNRYAWALIQQIWHYRLEDKLKSKDNYLQYCDMQWLDVGFPAEIVALNFTGKSTDWNHVCRELEHTFRESQTFEFSRAEIDLAKKSLLHVLEQTVANDVNVESSQKADRFTESRIWQRCPYMNPQQKLDYYKKFEGQLTPAFCWKLWQQQWSQGCYLFVAGNLDPQITEKQIAAVWNQSKEEVLQIAKKNQEAQFTPPVFGKCLGQIVEQHVDPETKIETIRFKNNVRLNLKKTDIDKDTICIQVSVGSGLLTLNTNYCGLNTLLSAAFIDGGLRQCSVTQLNKIFADKTLYVDFDVNDDAFVFKGITKQADFEKQVQLIGAYFIEPGYDNASLDLFRKQITAWYDHCQKNAEGVLKMQVPYYLSNNDNRFGIPALEVLQQRNFDEAKDWLRPVFDKGYIEIAVTGDFDRDAVVQCIQGTFGSFAERATQKERFEERRIIHFPTPPQTRTYTFNSDLDRALIYIVWPTESIWNRENVRALMLLKEVLMNRLLFAIRQNMGDTYSPNVGNQFSSVYKDYGFISAKMIVAPNRVPEVTEKIVQIANEIGLHGVDADERLRALKPIINDLKEYWKTNRYWMSLIYNLQEYPEKRLWALENAANYESITCEKLTELAKQYLNKGNAIRVLILPEKRSQSEKTQQ